MPTYRMDAECNSCGAEQNQLLELPEDYTDEQLRDALENQAHECDSCGDSDWAPMPDSLAEVQ